MVDAKRVKWTSLSKTSSEIHVKILFHIIAKTYGWNYSLYMLFELKLSGKTSEKKYAASLGTKAKQIFFSMSAIESTEIQFHISSVR